MNRSTIIIQTEHLSDGAAQWLAQRCTLIEAAPQSAEFNSAIASASALVVRTYTNVDAALLERAPKLRVVGRAGVGLDNIDVRACRARGIEVVYAPDANTQAVVEYVLFLLGDILRPRHVIASHAPLEEWERLRAEHVGRRQLGDLTLGILGMGRVGKRIARAASGLGMRVLYNDLLEIAPAHRFGAEPVALQALFAESHVVTIHIDGRASNTRFVNAALIDGMRSDAIFINTSRGFVVDGTALAVFMRRNPAATALLDVHDPEPFKSDYPLLGLPNVRLYPHLASRTQSAMENMSWVVKDVVAVLEGMKPEFAAPSEASAASRSEGSGGR